MEEKLMPAIILPVSREVAIRTSVEIAVRECLRRVLEGDTEETAKMWGKSALRASLQGFGVPPSDKLNLIVDGFNIDLNMADIEKIVENMKSGAVEAEISIIK